MSHFNAANLEIRHLDQSIAMSALAKGLQKNDLKNSLSKTYPKNFAGMLARAEKYARMKVFMLKENPPTSTLRGGKEMRGCKLSSKHEERVRPSSRSLREE